MRSVLCRACGPVGQAEVARGKNKGEEREPVGREREEEDGWRRWWWRGEGEEDAKGKRGNKAGLGGGGGGKRVRGGWMETKKTRVTEIDGEK